MDRNEDQQCRPHARAVDESLLKNGSVLSRDLDIVGGAVAHDEVVEAEVRGWGRVRVSDFGSGRGGRVGRREIYESVEARSACVCLSRLDGRNGSMMVVA